MTRRILPAIDKTITLNINGSRQHIRLCAERAGSPPLLVVQAGPGLPVLHEVAKFQRLLNLEMEFLVSYWEQRGCGDASRRDAESVSMQQQVDDLRSVLRWLYEETRQRVVVFGISLGGTIVLQAVEHARDHVKAVIGISPDSQTQNGDAAADAFLQAHSGRAAGRVLRRRMMKLGKPPYVDPAALQRRARLLADLGAIEHGRTFNGLLREMLFSMIRTYGVFGTMRSLRNMNLVQRKVLPEVVSLDLLANPPRVAVPVHYVFGGQDALNPPHLVKRLPATIDAPGTRVTLVPDAGHMVHFDHPDVVRSIAVTA